MSFNEYITFLTAQARLARQAAEKQVQFEVWREQRHDDESEIQRDVPAHTGNDAPPVNAERGEVAARPSERAPATPSQTSRPTLPAGDASQATRPATTEATTGSDLKGISTKDLVRRAPSAEPSEQARILTELATRTGDDTEKAFLTRVASLLGKSDSVANAAAGALDLLRRLAVADAVTARLKATFVLSMAQLDHEESIIQSRLNTRTWVTLMKGGIDGLVAYHKGGVTPDDVANIIRSAQTIALGVIASK